MQLSMSSPSGGGGGGGRGRATHGNLTLTFFSRVGTLIGHHAFDVPISNSRREVNHYFLLGGGDFDNLLFFF